MKTTRHLPFTLLSFLLVGCLSDFYVEGEAAYYRGDYDEAVEALLSAPHVERGRASCPSERRYMARGQTSSGRRLTVVFAREGDGWARIVTAYEPRGRKQTRRHRRR